MFKLAASKYWYSIEKCTRDNNTALKVYLGVRSHQKVQNNKVLMIFMLNSSVAHAKARLFFIKKRKKYSHNLKAWLRSVCHT